VPNQLLGHSLAPGFAGAAHLSEELSGFNARRLHPVVQHALNPIRHWDGPNMTVLADQVNDRPMPFALLHVIDC
jgi:hypothetical protein